MDPAHARAFHQAAVKSFVSSQREHADGPTGSAETKEVFGLALPRSGYLNTESVDGCSCKRMGGFNIWDKLTSLTKAKQFPF